MRIKSSPPILVILLLASISCTGQLSITTPTNPLELAQRLVGNGVTISNVSFTGNIQMTGFFQNAGGNNISIDSGIVLTSGRARSGNGFGVNGNGTTTAQVANANTSWNLPGDDDLAAAIGQSVGNLRDACILQFDFVPLGDSIRFNYIFGSEEYTPEYVCEFNDAFAFFISGPGFIGKKNIALVPNTNIPVSIFNVNNVPGGTCPNNPGLYVDNRTNTTYTHDGHTVLFTAAEKVTPCQTYTLKIVISDVIDGEADSGVFIEAKSLASNTLSITNLTQTDPTTGLSYLVEGCQTGAFSVSRPRKDPFPLTVNLLYGGSTINGVDYAPMTNSVVIPANDSFVVVNVIPLVDGNPEGIETLKVYALAGCTGTGSIPSDSTTIQFRDYDLLSLSPDTAFICKNGSVQLIASSGYSTYQWNNSSQLSNSTIATPIATPTNAVSFYVCTATLGTCNARDSVFVRWKDIEFLSKQDINCRNGSNGIIRVAGGSEWQAPVLFSIDGINWQSDSIFNNLSVGTYRIRIRDLLCADSMDINLVQAFPDLSIASSIINPASCSGLEDGSISITANGGWPNYQYSKDGINFQSSSLFNVAAGNYQISVKDDNGCVTNGNYTVSLNDTVTVDAGIDATICEREAYTMMATSNAANYTWSPINGVNNPSVLNPVVTPSATTKYYLTATSGVCEHTDSITVFIRTAPIANAGPDASYCYGKVFQLQGSGGVEFNWSPRGSLLPNGSVASPSVKALNNISYFLKVKDINGCESLNADTVSITVVPALKLFVGRDTIVAINQPLQLNVQELSSSGVIQYEWSPGQNLNNRFSKNPIAILAADQRFIVTARTAEGCEAQQGLLVKVYKGPDIYVPSGFTPDNNGLNDLLRPIPVGIRQFQFFRVYNRQGQLVFSSQNAEAGWDGRINGMSQQSGVFVWMAQGIDYRGQTMTRKGTTTIVR